MTFGGQWFCYSLHPVPNPTLATISGNACKNLVAGSNVVKLTDKLKECGFLNSIPNVQVAYLGIYLPGGVKKSATAFKNYDGTSPNPLNWLAGRPNNNSAYSVLYCDKNQLGRVGDSQPISVKTLVCKKPATKLAPCPAPLTSTTTSTTSTTTTTTSATTTTTSLSGKCAGLEDLITRDAATNSTRLTTALNAAYATWSRTDKANFAGYKKRTETILWDDTLTVQQKLNMTGDVLSGFMPPGSEGQRLLYAVAIDPWGTVCDYVNCVCQSADPRYVPQTCPTVSSTSTYTSTSTTQPDCKYPTNTSQASLVVFDEEQRNGDIKEIGFCSCDVGKKAFYNSGPTARPSSVKETSVTFVEYSPVRESDCADLCIIDEAGNECTPTNTSWWLTVSLNPYCVNGKCHMYVILSNLYDLDTTGLNCGWKKFSGSDQFDIDSGTAPLDPDTSPQDLWLSEDSRWFNLHDDDYFNCFNDVYLYDNHYHNYDHYDYYDRK